MRFSGSFVALVTPFHEDGSIHMEKLKELVEWHIEQGTDGIVALGTTGESSTMTHEEDDEVARLVIETVNGRIPAVSYTHLDVYKRQGRRRAERKQLCHHRRCGRGDRAGRP